MPAMVVAAIMPSSVRTARWPWTYLKPSTKCAQGESCAGRLNLGKRMASRQPITARKLIPLSRKQTRAPLKMAELSEMAFSRSSLLVIWMMSDWRPGISKALMVPSATASARMCQTCTLPLRVRAASTSAWHMERIWVTTTRRCRE